jgi:NADH-quinone oxidoreductase subunit G
MTFRSDRSEVTTYIEKSVDHELSGNIIDLCPVGALNNKPYRYNARAWEMVARPLVSPHDCAGSNMFAHVLRRRIRRMVPRENDAINESWLADRDRYSCHGIYGNDRLLQPRVKRDGSWVEVSWQDALAAAVGMLKKATEGGGASGLGTLVSPSATLEEAYLLQRITRHLGSDNIDYRLRQRDFRDQNSDPKTPLLGCSIADLETRKGIFVIGSNLRMEVPIVAHRVRKAALKGASVAFLNTVDYAYYFKPAAYVTAAADTFVANLAAVLVAAANAAGTSVPGHLARAVEGVAPTDTHRAAAAALAAKPGLVLLGHIAQRHPQYADVRALAAGLAAVTGATLGYLSEGANAAGAALAGATPHRGPGAQGVARAGFDARAMLETPRNAYILFGIEPSKDVADGAHALAALRGAAVVAFTPFVSDELLDVADVLLPTGTFVETAGTYVNVEGRWQSFDAVADAVGEARPGWRVLRVLGNELELPNCEYLRPSDVTAELERELGAPHELGSSDTQYKGSFAANTRGAPPTDNGVVLDVPIYAIDMLVRRSQPLQDTVHGRQGAT